VLSDEFLAAMIRVNSNPMRDMAREYLERVMIHLQSQQGAFEQALGATLGKTGLDRIGKATLEPYLRFQERMFTLWSEAIKPPLAGSDDDARRD